MASVRSGDVVAEKYRVGDLLGSGGMGAVYAARHLGLDQNVAIKFLTKGALADEEARARFRQEAKAAVRLKNDHIAKVFDAGVHDTDEPYIVMEFLDGSDLSSVSRKRGPVPTPEAVEMILQACEALAEAHANGIIHRDVKLANLYLTKTASGWPLVKVLDFGISKNVTALDGDVTKTAAMLGSPKFMSPEQMKDPRDVDGRTDVWSLGVCLYRLVTGVAPFDGDTIGNLCTKVLTQPPPPIRALRADVPQGFELVIDACLAKERDLRLATVAHLAAALVPFAPDVERAKDVAAHVSAVLGIPLPPLGPPVPPAMTSARSTWSGAWSSTQARSSPLAAPAPRSASALYAAAGALAIGVSALTLAVVHANNLRRDAPAAAAPGVSVATPTLVGAPTLATPTQAAAASAVSMTIMTANLPPPGEPPPDATASDTKPASSATTSKRPQPHVRPHPAATSTAPSAVGEGEIPSDRK